MGRADASLRGAEEFELELGEGPAGALLGSTALPAPGPPEQSERLDDRCCVAVGFGRSVPGVGDDIADPDGPNSSTSGAGHSNAAVPSPCAAAPRRPHCPILKVHGSNAHTMPPNGAQLIYDSGASADVGRHEIVWCERS